MEARKLSPHNPVFEATREKFEGVLGRVQSESWQGKSHSEAEEALAVEGRELMRCLLEEWIAVRAAAEPTEPVVGAEGIERTRVRRRPRHLTTSLGVVSVSRLGYGCPGLDSLFVLDAELNLPEESYSLGLRRRVATEAAKVSFDEVGKAVLSATGVTIPKRQLEELAERSAVDFSAFYKQRVPAANGDTGPLLVISTDGKGIAMRRSDLREATRKAAEQRQPKLTKRLCKGEKTATRRMAQVAAVYTVEPYVRTPEDIAGTLGPSPTHTEPPERPRPEDKRVWASVTDEAFDVIGEALAEAERRDPEHTKTWLILVDGGEHQLRCIRQWLKKKRIQATIIVDIIHVLEYLWTAAHALFAEGTPELENYVTVRLLRVLQGKASHVAAGMRRSATLQGATKEQRRPIDRCANYLLKYARYMRYDQYLAAGYPIATGVIEGACRYLVKDRMDITGARWSLAGAEAVLRLRALRASGDFDAYWTFHEAQELQRNHLKSYADHVIPPTQLPSGLRPKPTLRVVP
jgi:hypothetical protein